jgi:hypothetical protein
MAMTSNSKGMFSFARRMEIAQHAAAFDAAAAAAAGGAAATHQNNLNSQS